MYGITRLRDQFAMKKGFLYSSRQTTFTDIFTSAHPTDGAGGITFCAYVTYVHASVRV